MLSYRTIGKSGAPCVVFLHGFLGSKEDWNEIIEQLADDFFCISIDLPGHGGNGINDNSSLKLPTPGFNRCAELVHTTLKQLNISQYHLVGYSLGGRIALHLARLYPQALQSLCLESCHPGLQNADDRVARQANDRDWADKLANLPIKEFLSLWYQQAVFSDLTQAERKQLIHKRANNSAMALLNCYQATSLAEQQDLWDTPSLLPISSHFIAGHQDQKFMALAKRWQQQQPLSLHCIEASGHNVHLAAPEAFTEQLKTIFASNSNF
ncbi:2-succinyl-6-hydroxy-2,4-cyclohexadiene-1-carboxylate synthase [Shewanella schlegeliana]|uniref:Putative 2-succinyl-6-hydroxy-2,4-cyclohexadiene-1-carboxylate synthase n=1 Tax=Shewanella schlegeliana TaxID=190308 RepID=A0ABS1T1E5_9GAMM|nr:2-succinyl-6-hydroxy-2,4-cyclohexadiene-1-carboxylate synthase [Shewanella schlegeliana]MBL4914606.1 2-succinyl-6-hydroxy-2,4-cyclohexadiene-1-carboxylate synthase [Shewanella schlegeliana]MCL1109578.1 2-succinyl-6-hydroxy-2,4-cyclohexadiene-1-carboxylate synthase [Shewanella schlegeliana]GIU29770.1 putative 2-succinyl-6-hydroxy-2,4-cyclohexadiene-1-carboxylate synthase [Shewanella schlegeliana]